VVSVLLTLDSQGQAPISGKKFAASVISAAGVTVDQIMFGCDEFVTSYFSDAGRDRPEWRECWDMRLLLSQKIDKRALKMLAAFPIEESPDSVGEVRAQIPVRVIADFDSLEKCAKCKDVLQARALAQTIRWPDRYLVRDVEPHRQQLCVDIGTVPRSRISELIPDAERIRTICQELGGRIRVSLVPPT